MHPCIPLSLHNYNVMDTTPLTFWKGVAPSLGPGLDGMTFSVLACTSSWYCNGPSKAEGLLISLLPRTILLSGLGKYVLTSMCCFYKSEVVLSRHVEFGQRFERRIGRGPGES